MLSSRRRTNSEGGSAAQTQQSERRSQRSRTQASSLTRSRSSILQQSSAHQQEQLQSQQTTAPFQQVQQEPPSSSSPVLLQASPASPQLPPQQHQSTALPLDGSHQNSYNNVPRSLPSFLPETLSVSSHQRQLQQFQQHRDQNQIHIRAAENRIRRQQEEEERLAVEERERGQRLEQAISYGRTSSSSSISAQLPLPSQSVRSAPSTTTTSASASTSVPTQPQNYQRAPHLPRQINQRAQSTRVRSRASTIQDRVNNSTTLTKLEFDELCKPELLQIWQKEMRWTIRHLDHLLIECMPERVLSTAGRNKLQQMIRQTMRGWTNQKSSASHKIVHQLIPSHWDIAKVKRAQRSRLAIEQFQRNIGRQLSLDLENSTVWRYIADRLAVAALVSKEVELGWKENCPILDALTPLASSRADTPFLRWTICFRTATVTLHYHKFEVDVDSIVPPFVDLPPWKRPASEGDDDDDDHDSDGEESNDSNVEFEDY